MTYFIYIIECKNGAYYTGYTTDIARRYREHQQGTEKCKYTRSFPPKRLAACWKIDSDLSQVLKIECAIKKLKKKDKSDLIEKPEDLFLYLTETGLDDGELKKAITYLVIPEFS